MQRHLESCDRCLRVLEQLLARETDPLVMSLKHSLVSDPFLAEPSCQRAVRRIALDPQLWQAENAEKPSPRIAKIGSYRVEEMIAEGGMGIVFRAVHEDLNKTVAIKLLRSHLPPVPEVVRRFRRECRTLGQMQHPNLVTAFDAGATEGTPFLVMEYVAGIDLAKLVKRSGVLSAPNACELVRQAATGLEYAWKKGVVHRDVKPSNLMLTRDGWGHAIVKVLDLGVARLLNQAKEGAQDDSTLSSDGQIMGTRAYMAPEQARDSHDVDTRADVYSLGATLHELLTGRPPLPAVGDGPNLSLLEPVTPPTLLSILRSVLAPDREHRPPSPAAVAQLLAPLAAGHLIESLLS